MMQFVSVPQAMPDKRAADERRTDFQEIYDQFSEGGAAEQAARCEQCGIPFCQVHCTLHNNIPNRPPVSETGATAHMMIANPFHGKSLSKLFSTHPDPAERIRRLRAM